LLTNDKEVMRRRRFNPADVKATFENGVLEVVAPLPATALAAPRKVEIAGEEKKVVKPIA
jgi:HSP20 family molecular chaperone IbpA